jgi:hypothetical protein
VQSFARSLLDRSHGAEKYQAILPWESRLLFSRGFRTRLRLRESPVIRSHDSVSRHRMRNTALPTRLKIQAAISAMLGATADDGQHHAGQREDQCRDLAMPSVQRDRSGDTR